MKVEFKKCFDRGQFKIMFLIIYIMTVLSFIAECMESTNCSMTLLRSANESTFLTGANTFLHAMVMVMPIMASLIYADSYEEEKKNGINKYIATRIDIKRYLLGKGVVVFIMNFLCFFIPIIMNMLLCKWTFPKIGHDSIYGLPPYALELNYSQKILFNSLRLESPWIYNLVHALGVGLFAGILGLIIYGVFFISEKNKLKTVIEIYIIYVIWETVFGVLNVEKLRFTSYMVTGAYGTKPIMFGIFLVLFIIGMVLIGIGIKKESIDAGV